MTTSKDQPTLIAVFGKVVRLLGDLPSNDERQRVLAAVICLLDDDHQIAQAVVKRYAAGEDEG